MMSQLDRLKAKYDDLDDIVATTGQTMLGLTVNCARCHDHKIDPIPQADYYKMVSFFENIRHYGVRSHESVHAASVRTVLGEAQPQAVEAHQKRVDHVDQEIEKLVQLARPGFKSVEHEDFKYEMNQIAIMKKRVGDQLTQKQFDRFRNFVRQRKELAENPAGSVKVLCVKESGPQPPPSFVRVRGNPHVKGPSVEPGFLSVLPEASLRIDRPADNTTSGRRLAFANWVVDTKNPLTSRVMVNRIWQYHFGRGIVRSASDFGFQGTQPTHPQLLDWLASEFVNQKWSVKHMHRVMMLSNTYQMSSKFSSQHYAQDPANNLFWRFNLRRLTAEEIRDSILSVSGQLNLEKMYGPSIYPTMPKEVLAGQSRPGEGWGGSSDEDRRRRSVYVHIKRSLALPILSTNDAADTDSTCPVRFITTQPTQALGMLNSAFTNDQAKHFASAVQQASPDDRKQQVRMIIERVTQRPATQDEIVQGMNLMQFWETQEDASKQQALEFFCLLAMNMNEFVYVD